MDIETWWLAMLEVSGPRTVQSVSLHESMIFDGVLGPETEQASSVARSNPASRRPPFLFFFPVMPTFEVLTTA
jgi:hypothetical protein